jgi:hypothetical protein
MLGQYTDVGTALKTSAPAWLLLSYDLAQDACLKTCHTLSQKASRPTLPTIGLLSAQSAGEIQQI